MLLPPLKSSSSTQLVERFKEAPKDQNSEQGSSQEELEDSIDIYTTEDGTRVTDIRTNQERTSYKKVESPDGDIIVSQSARSRRTESSPPSQVQGYGVGNFTFPPPRPEPEPEPEPDPEPTPEDPLDP